MFVEWFVKHYLKLLRYFKMFSNPLGKYMARVRDELQPYIVQAQKKEQINLITLAAEVNKLIDTFFKEDDLIIHPPYQPELRVISINFTRDDKGSVGINYNVTPL